MKTTNYIVIVFIILGIMNGYSQTLSKNYIQTFSVQQIGIEDASAISNMNSLEKIAYIDGLGRNIQTIAVHAGGNSEDIVTHIEYDSFGRQSKEYLSYASSINSGAYRSDALIETSIFYNTEKYEYTTNPYSEKLYDGSPLNLVIETASPGNSWKEGILNEHTIKNEYKLIENTDEVANFQVSNNPNGESPWLDYKGLFTVGVSTTQGDPIKAPTLYKFIVKNENWSEGQQFENDNTVQTFKDYMGRTILSRTFESNERQDTYYVYDNYGNLTFVIPPQVEIYGSANTQSGVDDRELSELCYQYKYDTKNRLIEKKLPGKGREYIVYDQLNRPVLTQDTLQRASGQWLFSKYDSDDRVVYTGIFTSTSTRIYLQSQIDAMIDPVFFESRGSEISIAGATVYYSNNVFPYENIQLLTINYYDDYNFDLAGSFDPYIINRLVYGEYPTKRTTGLATGTKIRVIGTENWITNVTYYDDKARPIYAYSKNDYLGTTNILETKLDFVGKPEETTSTHKKTGKSDIVIRDVYEYDHVGRLLAQKQTINGQTEKEELIVQNSYDELGQLIRKGIGGTISQARLQNIDYTYNIRGWLKGINDVNNLGNDLFGFKINYNAPEISGSTAMFNGNISETIWKTKNDETSSTPWVQRAYGYQYDPLNRITKGDFKIKNSTGVFVSSNYTEYCLSNVTYDKNGNIRTLRRYTNSGYYPMDDLTYSYDIGNKLLKVVDNGHPTIKVNGFKDGTNTGNDYTYDGNGNLKEDKNKGIADIIYNHLNLPSQITFASGKIEYFYDAVGTKQKKKVTNGAVITTTEYAGNYIYQNNVLQMISQPEGYLEPNGQGGYDYTYQYKDHLGNIRLSYWDSEGDGNVNQSDIKEENNYYPFGLKHSGYNMLVFSANLALKYKYNGKELQDDLIGSNSLDWYDYGARFYDPAIGRWQVMDPLAEKYHSWSPYNYAVNSPIRFLDPDGKSPDEFDQRADEYLHGKQVSSLTIDGLGGSITLGGNTGEGAQAESNTNTLPTTIWMLKSMFKVRSLSITNNYKSSLQNSNVDQFSGVDVYTFTPAAATVGWDLNADGKFQKNEADNRWLNGKGFGVTVDNSKIDWTGLEVPQGLSYGDTFAISTTDAFLKLPFETAATYGGTSFEVVSPVHVKVLDQKYHYDYRPNNSNQNRARNFMNWFGKPSGEGVNFKIHYNNPNIWIK